MFDWLAVGWNLAMTVSGAFLVSLSFRTWPLRFDRAQAIGHTLLTVFTALILMVYPHALLRHVPPLDPWSDMLGDLRYVPLVALTLAHRPGWALLAGVVVSAPQVVHALLAGQTSLAWPPLAVAGGVLLLAALQKRNLGMLNFTLREAALRLPLIFLPCGLPFLFNPVTDGSGWHGNPAPALLTIMVNLTGFLAGVMVLRSRFKLLAVSARLSRLAHTDPLTGLNELAKQIAAKGVKEIVGEVLIDDRLFEKSSSSGSGPSVVTSIIVNDNVVDVTVAPGETEGSPAKVTMRPETSAVQMDSEVVTIAEKGEAHIGIVGDGAARFRVRGRVPLKSGPKIVIHGIDDPLNFARTLFVECLRRNGVRVVAGKFQAQRNDLPKKADYDKLTRIATFTSLPLSEALKVTLKVSHNLYASTLPLLVAAKHGDDTLAEGLHRQRRFLKDLGVDAGTISFAGGAGGMIADCVTPAATIQLLKGMDRHPAGKVYFESLPVLGVDGTLFDVVGNDSPAKGKVRAKTGTLYYTDVLNDRSLLRSKALAGDVETKSGHRLFIAMFVNNVPLPKGVTSSREGKTLGRLCEAIYESAP